MRSSRPRVTDAPVDVEAGLAEQYLGKLVSLEQHAFVALNTAFLARRGGDPGAARSGAGEAHSHRLQRCSDGTHVAPRALIVVGADAHCTIVESYSGTGTYFTNAVTEIVVGGSRGGGPLQGAARNARGVSCGDAAGAAGTERNFKSHSISLGGALVRNDVNVVLSEGTEATVNGLYIVQRHAARR